MAIGFRLVACVCLVIAGLMLPATIGVAGTITGKVFNLDATGTLNKSGNIKIEVFDSANASVAVTYSDSTGAYNVNVSPAALPANKAISLKFSKIGSNPTVTITGIPGDSPTNQAVNATVP